MVISSRTNPTIKEIAKLNDKKYRKEYGLYLVEGVKPVNECITAGCTVKTIVCTEELSENYPRAIVVTQSVFSVISSEKTPQGVLAVVEIPSTAVKRAQNSCILLDNVQDPGNLGTIIRTANAAGYKDVYLINCVDPYSPKAVRASMSGIFFVNIYIGSREEALEALGGVKLVCADMDGESVFSFNPPDKFCLCIGNEGNGISDEVMRAADYKISIPMNATCESLNAAVSAGIAMYQLKYGKVR